MCLCFPIIDDYCIGLVLRFRFQQNNFFVVEKFTCVMSRNWNFFLSFFCWNVQHIAWFQSFFRLNARLRANHILSAHIMHDFTGYRNNEKKNLQIKIITILRYYKLEMVFFSITITIYRFVRCISIHLIQSKYELLEERKNSSTNRK